MSFTLSCDEVTKFQPGPAPAVDLLAKADTLMRSQDPSDHADCINCLFEAAEKGNGMALYKLGVACAKSQASLPRSQEWASELWSIGVERRESECAFALGCAYETGRGVPKDTELALRLWKHSADLGGAHGKFMYLYAIQSDAVNLDTGFISFVKRNLAKTNGNPSKRGLNLEACLALY